MPSGWSWHAGHTPHYLQMILSVYATLGIFLLIASRKPLAHLSLIWFTVWSSVVHAAVMAVQSLANPEHMGHLWGDVLGLFLVAVVFAFLTPRAAAADPQSAASRHRFCGQPYVKSAGKILRGTTATKDLTLEQEPRA